MEDFWWRQHPSFVLQQGDSRAHPGLENWYEWVWKPQRVAAWAYELVRRLPDTKVKLNAEMTRTLREMPPYNQLSVESKEIIILAFPRRFRSTARFLSNPNGITLFEEGYAKLPDFDTIRGTFADLKKLYAQFQEKRSTLTGGRSRKKDRTEKLGNWELVELLASGVRPETKRRRDLAIKHAKYFLPYILTGWRLCNVKKQSTLPYGAAFPEILDFSCETFTQEEVKNVVNAIL